MSFPVQSLISFLHSKSYENKLLNEYKVVLSITFMFEQTFEKALKSCNLKFESWIYDIEINIEKNGKKPSWMLCFIVLTVFLHCKYSEIYLNI